MLCSPPTAREWARSAGIYAPPPIGHGAIVRRRLLALLPKRAKPEPKLKRIPLTREQKKENWKRWYSENIDANRARGRENARLQWLKNRGNPHFRMAKALRLRLWKKVKEHGGKKAGDTLELTGCTMDALRVWLSSKFQDGMTWANYGAWEIDHVVPCNSFDLSKPEHQRMCFHYTNLQPLWMSDNRRKWAHHPTPVQNTSRDAQIRR
jgi:hypothetical protein